MKIEFHFEIVVSHYVKMEFQHEISVSHYAKMEFHFEIGTLHYVEMKFHFEIISLQCIKSVFRLRREKMSNESGSRVCSGAFPISQEPEHVFCGCF